MSHDPNLPYNDLPELPPGGIELETKSVLKKTIEASRALTELRGVSNQIPNPTVILRWAMLKEAQLSSEIENIFTTNDELYQGLDEQGATNPAVKEVLRYQEALWHGFNWIRPAEGDTPRPLTTRLFVELVQILKQTRLDIRKTTGTRIADGKGQTLYTPPEGEQVIRAKLANLERFLYDPSGLDPMVKMAVAHYQFEAIHPFPDGNGRTGRVINLLYLIDQELLDVPVLYLSKHIIDHKATYYSLLQNVTEQADWEPWILFMLEGIAQTARQTTRQMLDIQEMLSQAIAEVRSGLPKIYSKELVELIFTQPYCRIRNLEEAQIAERKTASVYLRELARIGWLVAQKQGREVVYVNQRYLDLLSS